MAGRLENEKQKEKRRLENIKNEEEKWVGGWRMKKKTKKKRWLEGWRMIKRKEKRRLENEKKTKKKI